MAVKSNSPELAMKKLSQSGVIKIPINPEMLALKIAVGKFPLAIATITTEDDTVEGRTPKKKIDNQSSEDVPASKNGMKSIVSKGNSKKVES